jgi:hypothetical protein
MKVPLLKSSPRGIDHAFTLVETVVCMGVFGLVVVAFVYAQMFGFRYDQMTNAKMGASDEARRSFGLLANDIESAKLWRVGSGSASAFAPCGNGSNQIGNTIQLSPSTDTNRYIRYFFDSTNKTLSRFDSSTASTRLIADNLTNTFTFRAEDYLGAPVTNLQYKYLIHVLLEFSQRTYPKAWDYYKIDFRLTPHCPDGA